MEQENQLQGQIAQVLIRFVEIHLQAKPRAALVDMHEHSIVVTLEDIVPPVERDYARDNKGHELLDKSYTCVFACLRVSLPFFLCCPSCRYSRLLSVSRRVSATRNGSAWKTRANITGYRGTNISQGCYPKNPPKNM